MPLNLIRNKEKQYDLELEETFLNLLRNYEELIKTNEIRKEKYEKCINENYIRVINNFEKNVNNYNDIVKQYEKLIIATNNKSLVNKNRELEKMLYDIEKCYIVKRKKINLLSKISVSLTFIALIVSFIPMLKSLKLNLPENTIFILFVFAATPAVVGIVYKTFLDENIRKDFTKFLILPFKKEITFGKKSKS